MPSPAPYVRVLQLGPTGRVVKKKKTGAQHGTREPHFNETLNFELDLQQEASEVHSLVHSSLFRTSSEKSSDIYFYFQLSVQLSVTEMQIALSRL